MNLGAKLASRATRETGRRRRFWTFSDKAPVGERTYEVVKPAPFVRRNIVDIIPAGVTMPDYATSGSVEPSSLPAMSKIWTKEEVEGIRIACRIARSVLDRLGELLVPGATTEEVDRLAHEMIVSRDAYPSPLNFHGFPKSISTSVNNVAAHGIPDGRVLKSGDLVSADVTVFAAGGFHGDCSETFVVGGMGSADQRARMLLSAATECLYTGVSACGPGEPFRKIGHAIHRLSKRRQVSVIPILCGHGIGTFFHGPPDVYHALNNYPGVMEPGMVFTIEPCVTEGGSRVRILEDGWTVVTADDCRTAQFEHTLLITDTGVDILTA